MSFVRVVCLLLVSQLAFSYGQGSCTENYETCLMKHLKARIATEEIDVRPYIEGSNETVVARFGISLISIDSLKLIQSTEYKLTANVYFKNLWNDHRLTWDPESFGDLACIRIPIRHLWRPDMFLYNNMELNQQVSEEAMAVVSSDGSVLWVPTAKMTVQAKRQKSWLSVHDTYTASFKYGSWTYDGSKLDVAFYGDKAEMDVTDYISHDSFEIIEQSAVRNVKKYPCCPEQPYPDLTFSMKFKVM